MITSQHLLLQTICPKRGEEKKKGRERQTNFKNEMTHGNRQSQNLVCSIPNIARIERELGQNRKSNPIPIDIGDGIFVILVVGML